MCNNVIKVCLYILVILQISVSVIIINQSNVGAVKRIFSYFRREDPRGIPVLEVDEPLQLPFGLVGPRITVTNASVYGHSKLVIEDGYIDVGKLEGRATLFFPVLTMIGTYEYTALVSSNRGDINATVTEFNAILNVSMVIEEGIIQMKDITQNITKDELFLDLTNLTWLQQIVYDAGVFHMFFQPIAEIAFFQNRDAILNETNLFLREFSNTLPSSVSLRHSNKYYEQILELPTDRRNLVVFIGRILHFAEFDPVRPPNKDISVIGIKVKLTDIEVSGLSAVTDIKALQIFYNNKKINIKLSMVFPHILVHYNAAFSSFFIKIKSRPRNINLHNLETNVTMTIDPGEPKSIKKIKFNGKADWIGNINRYNSDSTFRKFLNRIEKFMQTHFLSIFIKIVQPEIEAKLRDVNLENAILSFIRNM